MSKPAPLSRTQYLTSTSAALPPISFRGYGTFALYLSSLPIRVVHSFQENGIAHNETLGRSRPLEMDAVTPLEPAAQADIVAERTPFGIGDNEESVAPRLT